MRFIPLILLIYSTLSAPSFAESLIYLTPNLTHSTFSKEQIDSIALHSQQIDILAPQIYQLDQHGSVRGYLDKKLWQIAQDKSLKLMPLIVNTDFDQDKFHQFLQNKLAQDRAIVAFIKLCEQYNFYGIQFDFENISVKDRDAYSQFTQHTATALHANGFKLSVAVIPRPDEIKTDYDNWFFTNWSGGYDYQALAKSSDFLSVMTYDQHTSLTTPGPIAAYDWTEKLLKTLLQTIPANKISLGIPTYSAYWATNRITVENMPEKYKFRSKQFPLSYQNAWEKLHQSQQTLLWNNKWKSSYAILSNYGRNEFLFIEDFRSFKMKNKLAQQYHLKGISLWKLGLEDKNIWRVI